MKHMFPSGFNGSQYANKLTNLALTTKHEE